MNVKHLINLLSNYPQKNFQILLPSGDLVPVSFHITEIGVVQKKFLDCGGTLRELSSCQLQVWLGEDVDHRIHTQKLLGIFKKAQTQIGLAEDLPVEIEYEDSVISQYTISSEQITEQAVILTLANKHTDCLAKELCGVSPNKDIEKSCCAPSTSSNKCCGPSGC